MSSTRQLRPWLHLEIRPRLRANRKSSTHGTSNIHRLSTYVQPSTTSNSHKHALHYQNSTYLCIASIYNTITNANIIYAASPTPTSPTSNIYNNETFSTADLFTSTPAQDIPTCFPRRDTIALLTHHATASESPVSPFYDTQHLLLAKGALLFPSLAFPFSLLFLFLSILLFWLSFFFSFGGTFTGGLFTGGLNSSANGEKALSYFWGFLESIFLF